MTFDFSPTGLKGNDAFWQRFFEILPGMTSWMILVIMLGLSVFAPIIAAIGIIAFDFYWLLRLLYMTLFLILSYFRLESDKDVDWLARIHGVDHLGIYLKNFRFPYGISFPQWMTLFIHKRELENLKKSGALPPLSKDIYHLVIIPVAKEPTDVVEPGLISLTKQKFPTKQILPVLTLEERLPEKMKNDFYALAKTYQKHFLDLMVQVHPAGLPGEAAVKGANTSWAAKKAAEFLKAHHIPFDHVVVSCFDADTVVGPDFFACLTYYFMTTPNRTRASFQPIPVYHNNIWQVPGFARVIESGSSFFQLIEATNAEKLVTFSSHSMNFQALVDVDYWPPDMISDDSAIFWKCFIHYDGDYRVIPIYITLSMDIAASETFWKTVRDVYKQKRRWAWGVENFPIVMRAFLKDRKIRFYDKLRYSLKLFEGHVSWATWGFLLTILAWIPTLSARGDFASSVLYYNTPYISRTIFHLASFSLIISIILSLALLPKKQVRHSLLKKISFALEWLSIPLILVFLSALPALDAQTRLMLGKRMEFWVSGKRRNADQRR